MPMYPYMTTPIRQSARVPLGSIEIAANASAVLIGDGEIAAGQVWEILSGGVLYIE
jgi:hypothetical protein